MADTDSQTTQQGWTEASSTRFIDMADVYVPARGEQIATLVGLIPAQPDEAFTVAELGAGAGALAHAVLAAFPRCQYVALDGSSVMRDQLRQKLAAFADRIAVRDFALAETAWRATLPTPLRCVLTSLAVHHLSGEDKRQLYTDLAERIELGGALLLADLVEPATPRVAALFARQWDDAARAQSLAQLGDLRGFERFQADTWNFFTPEGADPMDMPSRLADQLLWLRAAGFQEVDCFWMYAGHAIYGGYK